MIGLDTIIMTRLLCVVVAVKKQRKNSVKKMKNRKQNVNVLPVATCCDSLIVGTRVKSLSGNPQAPVR